MAPLQSNHLGGLKSDLLMLKILLKELPELNDKFNEMEIPLEFYFSEQLLTMFSGLFSCEILFRVWDVIFYEASVDGVLLIFS